MIIKKSNEDGSETYNSTHFNSIYKNGIYIDTSVTVPKCCFDCRYYYMGIEMEDNDELPCCGIGLVFPIKSKMCDLKETKRRTFPKMLP